MSYVALTRSGTIAPIVKFLDGIGLPTDRLLATANLPPWVMADREALIPATSPVRLFEAARRHTAVPNLGLTAGERADVDAFGTFGRAFRSAPTLGTALDAAVATARRSRRTGRSGFGRAATGSSSA